MSWTRMWMAAVGIGVVATVVYAAGGPKRTGETCAVDDDCSRGHCYTRRTDNAKVCVDCSSSTIDNYRGQVERFCKTEPRGCTDIPRTEEAAESYFKIRIENGDRCIAARKGENSDCWNGGDQGHREAVDQAESARKNCYDELNRRRGDGGIYECSDSTYSSRASDTDTSCAAIGKGCEEWAKDEKVVDCDAIEDAMKRAEKCVSAVERLDSDCLPRLSRNREAQFTRGKRAYDACKDILAHKRSGKFCK